MAKNYILLETVTVGAAGAASVVFNNIPQTGYTDLVVKGSVRGTNSAIFCGVKATFNSSSTNYSNLYLEGSGASASSGTLYTDAFFVGEGTGATATASTFGNFELYIPNYTSSNYKSASTDAVSENNATTAYTALVANLWSNTAAINNIALTNASAGAIFVQYSTATLYGINNS